MKIYYSVLRMLVEFRTPELKKLAFDARYIGKWPATTIRNYRLVIVHFQAILDRRSIYKWKGLCLEKLQGKRKGLYSVRLNLQWRLILSFKKSDRHETIEIIDIRDYH